VRIIHQGLGNIGLGIARILIERGHTIVAAIDIDPDKAGQDLGTLAGGSPLGVTVTADAAAALRVPADALVHCTGSRLPAVLPQLVAALEAGLDVASTCEELSFPWYHHPAEAGRLDELARARGVTLAGLGVNPGYVMDALALMLTAPCRDVTHVRVERIVDVATRREALQRKVGVGLTPEAFRAGVHDGRLAHVGLVESVAMIAHGLGWPLARITEDIDPVVRAGTVQGLHQVARGYRLGEEEAVVILDLVMAQGAADPHDAVELRGTPALRVEIPGGIHGDIATWAIVANALPLIKAAPPGLLSVSQLPLLHRAPPL
jgi:4-hydroxy-tetrahydrodipicolinate reductase